MHESIGHNIGLFSETEIPQLFYAWSNSSRRAISPTPFKSAFCEDHPEFANTSPQDAQEFFLACIDFLKETNLGKDLISLFTGEFTPMLECVQCLTPTILDAEEFYSVELEMCETESTLPVLLRKFSEPERLSEERRCGGCHNLAIVD